MFDSGEKVTAIIQARMGSTRLPGKVLMPLMDKPMIWHIVNRLNHVSVLDQVVVATSTNPEDDDLWTYCQSQNIHIYRGDEHDVLDRYYQTARSLDAKHILRITGDCPLVDPAIIKKLIDKYFTSELDFCGVAAGAGVAGRQITGRFPDGLDAEIFSFEVLSEAWLEADKELQREHVTPFIWKQPDRFNLGSLFPEQGDFIQYRWTVDNEDDFQFIRWIYAQLYNDNPVFGMNAVIKMLDDHPEKAKANAQYIGHEGYEKFWN